MEDDKVVMEVAEPQVGCGGREDVVSLQETTRHVLETAHIAEVVSRHVWRQVSAAQVKTRGRDA